MKKIKNKLNVIFAKVKAFFKRVNPFKKSSKVTLTLATVKKTIIKNKLLSGAVLLIVIAFIGGYFLKSLFVVATVNGSPITRMKIIRELEKRGGSSVLDSFVTEKLIQQEAAKKQISVTKVEIDTAIASIEANLISQSTDLATALAAQGMTLTDLRNQLTLQKLVEKLLADKVIVTDEEVAKYMTDNNITLPEGTDQENAKSIIKQQIVQEKLGQEAQTLITSLKSAAKINLFVKY